MKRHRHFLSPVVHLLWLLLPVLLLATAGRCAAAPTVTATKDDGVPTGVRKISGSTINYTNQINNTAPLGAGNDATGVLFTDPDVPHTTLVGGTVKVTPIAFDDAYAAIGNTQLTVSAANGLLANDIDPDNLPHTGTIVKVASVTHTGANLTNAVGSSTFTVAADGSFTYLPALAGTGTESYTYLVTDSDGLDSITTGTVTFTVTGRVWYVVAGGVGDGRSTTPSGSPSAMSAAANASTDVIYVYFNASTLDGAFTPGNGVSLIGEGVALVVNATLLRPAGSSPTIANSAGDAVTLGQNNTLAGFNVGNTLGKAIVGASVGALSVGTVSINTTGAGVDLTGVANPAVNVVLGGLTSGGGAKNVNLVSLGGTVNLGGGALSLASSNAFDVNGGNGTVSYSGTITNITARAVNIANRTGGTITLSGLVTSAGVGTGVNLAANAGATINFTGGLSLTTGVNDAFTATGGGTVNVTQNNTSIVNTITTTTGQALKVTGTTIGGSGLTFRSISSIGGTNNGVILDTTGSGNFTVSGNGGGITGGTIQGKNGADGSSATQGCGIYLNAVGGAVSLTGMDIEGCQNYGIRGLTVGGFTFANSTAGITVVNGTSNVADLESGFAGEGSIRFTNLTGTASITGCTLDGGFSRTAAFLVVAGGTMNLTIDGSTVRDTSVNAATSDALYVGTRNASTANLTVTNACQFTAYRQYAIQTDARDTSTMAINIAGSTFANSNAALVSSGGSLNLGSSASTDTLVQFNIQGNSFRHGAVASGSAPSNGGAHLVCGTVTGAGKFDGKFLNNTVGVTGVPFSGAGNGADALRMFASGNQGTTRVTGTTHTRYLVQGNTIKRYGEVGILFNSRQGNAIMDATVFGNTINEPGTAASGAFAGIWANCGALGADTNTMNLVIGSFSTAANKNTLQDSDPNDFSDVFLENDSAAGTVFNLFTNGSTAVTVRQVLIDDNNPTLDLDPGDGFISGTVTLQTGVPSVPPLLLAAGGVEKAKDLALPNAADVPGSARFQRAVSGFQPGTLTAPGEAADLSSVVENRDASRGADDVSGKMPETARWKRALPKETPAVLTQAQLDGVVSAALGRWEASGLTKEQLARLRSVSFEVADLPGWYLGEAAGSRIRVDNNAGGNGWHVDASAEGDALFGTVVSATRRYTDPASAPAGRIDLLTAVLHEMGHALGLNDSYLAQDRDSIMFGQLTKGERRLPSQSQAVGAVPDADGVTHFLAAPISIGTLPAGKSVQILYTVQVESPITPGTTTQTSSQATISGSNFANVLTDDPTVGGAADPTVTLLAPPPTVTMNTANQLISAPTVTINGTNFETTPANNTVVFNLGATGTVTASTATQLTVTFTTQPTSGGPLTANVTTFAGSSGAVQVATIIAVTITPNTANLAQNATQLIINGTGFSATPANNTVVLSSGTAVVTASTATQLTCTLGGPPSLGALNATVTVSGSGSAGPTQVATIVGSPTVTPNTANRAINAPTILIAGTNFSATPADNTVAFNLGATGTVTAATTTQLTVSFTTPPSTTGPLTANVTVFGGSSGATQVATIVPAPTVTLNTADRAINAPTIVIAGTNFSPTPADNTVVFNLGATGSVTAATATQLTVTFSAQPGATGSLTADVTTFGGSSGATQVATIVGAPTVTMNTTNIAQNAPTITIGGTNFSATPANNTVVFNLGAAGTVTSSTATQLTVTFTTPPSSTGPLTAVVTSNGGSSGAPVQVATVTVPVTYVVTTTGNQIVVTDTGGVTDTLTVSQPSAGNIQFSAAGRAFSVDGGPPIVGSSGPLSLTGVTLITMNAGTGADNVVVSGFTVTLPGVTIGSAANKYSTVSFTGAFSLGSTNSLTAHASGNISSTAAGILEAGGSITLNAGVDALINGNINHPTGADATLTVRAGNNIDFISGADVTSTSNRLYVVLDSNSDASGTGAIRLQSGTVITSNGGDITLGGGANPLTTPALGNATLPHGILLDSATLTAGAGAINLRGQGAAAATGTFNGGVTMNGSALVQTTSGSITSVAQGGTLGTGSYGFEMNGGQVTTANGAINITATAGSAASGNAGGFNAQTGGVALLATGTGTITVTGTGGTGAGTFDVGVQLTANTAIQVANGAMVLNGTATSGNSAGVRLSTTDSGRLLSTGSGTITVTGTGTGNGFGFQAGANSIVGGPSATGVITFINDTFDLTSGTPSVQTTATVNVRQKTNGVGIDLGGNDRGAGFLTATSLGAAAGYSVLVHDLTNTSNSAFQGAPIGVVVGDWKQTGGGATNSQQPTIVYLSPGFVNNGPVVETTVYDAPRLNAAWTDATAASANMAVRPPTTVLGTVSTNTVITQAAVGNYVVNIANIDLNHGESLTLNAPAGSTFVVNVSGSANISGDGSNGLLIAGGLGTSDVVYNFTGTGTVLKTSGGNESLIQGNVLAPNGSVELNSAGVTGEIIAKDIKSSGGTLTWAPAAAAVLGLADVELDRITTPTVNVGDANSGPIFSSKVISPANYRTLAIGNSVSFAPTGGFVSDIGPTATDIENITVTGTVTINAGATLSTAAKGGFVPVTGQSFRIITNDLADAISGTFDGLSEGATISGFLGSGINAHITYVGGTGNDLVIYTGAAPAVTPMAAASPTSSTSSTTSASPAPSTSTTSFASPAPTTSTASATNATQNAGSATGSSPVPSEPILLQTQTITNVTLNANGTVTIEFTGLPGYTYGLQYTPDMVVPWMTIGAVTTDALGEGHVVDTQPHSGGTGHYRLVYPYAP
jgi:hypothetical protein